MELHVEFLRHFSREWNLMLVVAENDELPIELRIIGLVLLLIPVDCFDIRDDVIKISAHPVDLVCLLRRAVDRTGELAELIAHQALEHFFPGVIQVDAIARG